nr:transposase [Burkholderia pseudomultivorans]
MSFTAGETTHALKNEIHAVLAAHLIEQCPATDLFGKKGRAWLGVQPLPLDERLGVEQRLRELDPLGEDLHEVEQALAQATIDDARLRVMMTITGVNTTVTIGLLSAIGDIERFPNPEKLVSYFGLNPSVYQSGPTPARHGHITKRGRCWSRLPGAPRRRLGRCAPSSCACAIAAASKLPSSQPLANSQ